LTQTWNRPAFLEELQAAGTEVWEQKEKQLEEQLAAKEAEILKLQKERQLLDCRGYRWFQTVVFNQQSGLKHQGLCFHRWQLGLHEHPSK